jgi:hypothetical protein
MQPIIRGGKVSAMSYSEELDIVCNEYLESTQFVSEIFAELDEKLARELIANLPALKNALIDELRTWKILQNTAEDRAEYNYWEKHHDLINEMKHPDLDNE